MSLRDIGPSSVALELAQIAETDPHHEIIVAVRLALEIADARRAEHRALREAALDVHSAHTPAEWRRWAQTRVSYDELRRRRGVEYGPDGRRRSVRGAA